MDSNAKVEYLQKLRRLKELRDLKKAQLTSTEAAPTPSGSDTVGALSSVAQGLSLGAAPKIAGLVDAVLSKTGTLLTGGDSNPYSGQTLSETYSEGKQDFKDRLSNYQNNNPVKGAALQALGSAPWTALLGGPGPLSGAALGSAEGFLGSDWDSASEVAKNALGGGAIGAATSGLGAVAAAAPVKALAIGGTALHNPMGALALKAVTDMVKPAIEKVGSSAVGAIGQSVKEAAASSLATVGRQKAVEHFIRSHQDPEYAKLTKVSP